MSEEKKAFLKLETKEISGVTIENRLYESSNVIKTSFNYNTGRLFVTYKNSSVYQYFDIPVKIYKELVETDSIGKSANKILKNYKYSKMAVVPENNMTLLEEEIKKLKDLK